MAVVVKHVAMEQAFALVGVHGFDGAGDVIVAGIRQACPFETDTVNAWVSIGECLNRIAALATAH